MGDYPLHLVRKRRLADGRTVTIRPIRADDERIPAAMPALVLATGSPPVHAAAAVDYEGHMAFVCEVAGGELVGEAQYLASADGRNCEFGVAVAGDWRQSGIVQLLMDALIRAAQARKLDTMAGVVLSENRDMLQFARSLGFELTPDPSRPERVRLARKL